MSERLFQCTMFYHTRFLWHLHIILYHLSVKPSQRLHISILTISFCFDDRYDRSFCPPATLTLSPRALKAFCNSEVISLFSFNTLPLRPDDGPSSHHSEPRPVRSTTPSYSPSLPQRPHYFQEEHDSTHLVFLTDIPSISQLYLVKT